MNHGGTDAWAVAESTGTPIQNQRSREFRQVLSRVPSRSLARFRRRLEGSSESPSLSRRWSSS